MRLEVKQNCITIKLTEEETVFLAQKAEQAGMKDPVSYAKAKLIEALGLEDFENNAVVSRSNDFNLAKIKSVTGELSQRKALAQVNYFLPGGDSIDPPEALKPSEPENKEVEKQATKTIRKPKLDKEKTSAADEPADDLLADLMDKDLLAGHKSVNINKKGADLD